MYRCPVCDFPGLTAKPYAVRPPPPDLDLAPPYQGQLGTASYEVCPRCGYEFGFDDNPGGGAVGESFEEYRRSWQAEGEPWFDAPDEEPDPLREGGVATDPATPRASQE